MLKKVITFICALSMIVSSPLSALGATTIGEDVYADAPTVQGLMNTQAEADAILTQLTSDSKSAVLTEDKVEGDYAVKVSTGDETEQDYAAYTLVNTEPFDISSCSRITLYVKPALNAKWVEFYTNGTLVKSDADQDGQYEVGFDLQSGVWNEVVLNLTQAEGLTQGDDLAVRTNEYSTWYYDNINSEDTPVTSFDLSRMVYSSTRLNDGRLEFKPSASPMYDATPSILMTNQHEPFIKIINNYYANGTLDGVTANSDNSLNLNGMVKDLCSGGTAISGGDYSSSYSASKAFDDSTSTNWRSSQSGTGVAGVAYIGYEFASSQSFDVIKLEQYSSSAYAVSSAILQYYNGSDWVDVQTASLSPGTNIININRAVSAQKWRLLANANLSSGNRWYVYEIGMYNYGTYTSNVMDISNVGAASSATISWEEKEGSALIVEANLSLDGGSTWQGWTAVENGGHIAGIDGDTDLSNARLQYRVSVGDATISETTLYKGLTVSALGSAYLDAPSLESGRLEQIHIDSAYADDSGLVAAKPIEATLSPETNKFALSGNGNILYYSAGMAPYKMDMHTGLSTSAGVSSPLWVNYDGTIVYGGGSLYNDNGETSTASVSTNICGGSGSAMQEDGTLFFASYYSYDHDDDNDFYKCYIKEYDNVNGVSTIASPTTSYDDGIIPKYYFATPQSGNIFYYADGSAGRTVNCYTKNSSNWTQSTIYTSTSAITSLFCNEDGSKVFFQSGDYSYCYEPATKTIRKLDINFTIKKVLDGDRLFGVDSSGHAIIYDVMTGEETFKQSFSGTTYIDIDKSGQRIVYYSSDNKLKSYLVDPDASRESYLLSFDGKNTWCSFKGGEYTAIAKAMPTLEDFAQYGMTKEEVNALDAGDYAVLYDDGRDIYTVDVAICFKSDDPYITPSLKAISFTTNEESSSSLAGLDARSIYAAKSEAFDGGNWRKVKRVYPIELAPKDARYCYFINVDGAYSYYDGSGWQDESAGEISALLADVETNWSALAALGMTATELKSIPEEALTDKLAGKTFTVVYPMKVLDKSTEAYKAIINIDYVADLFASTNLTLNIVMNDGTVQNFTSLSDTQVEDFMEWIAGRQHNRGPVFYTIKVGDMNNFINYYMIQSVKVEEQ